MIFPSAVFTLALFLAFAASFYSFSRFSSLNKTDRITIALLFPMAVCLAAVFLLKMQWSVYDDDNWERLQAVFALARGFPLYHSPDSGPVLVTIYGPVSMMIYSPSALVSSPMAAMRIAEAITMICFFLPSLILHFFTCRNTQQAPKTNDYRLFIFFIFSFFPFISKPLRDAAFNVHVDAPTLGLAALACGLLYFYRERQGRMNLVLSAVFAVLAVWSKQTAVPLLIALPLYLMMTESVKAGVRYTLYLLAAGGVISGLFLWVFNPQNLIFNILVIPGHQELRGNVPKALADASVKFFIEGIAVISLALVSLVPFILKRKLSGPLAWIRSWPGTLFVLVALFMAPLCILGKAKLGGSTNTFSYTYYFILLAGTLGLLEQAGNKIIRFLLNILGIVFICIYIPWSYKYILIEPKQQNAAETAYEYMKKHPGQIYFPRLGVLEIMANHKIYHASVALKDRRWAEMPLSQAHFDAYVPPDMKGVAFQEYKDIHMKTLGPYLSGGALQEGRDPELPGFLVYKK